ncbi:DUF1963 domain-containing protein [Frigoriglobus tundricola]|uniref:DUF1963 domain-containing protein n=1 Tax=Frigoriglobus tundricola TaxID=2774151 RepID=A0A6M5YK23_9BACT|nr:DUF1963 domain-containing protein [Frigoriglobus tundricola]QJW93636.1 hypothetical protein FTUN_1144 [Frigoriglobus tundricola]
MLEGESEWLAAVVANLLDDNAKLVYADWLQERGDDRAAFVRGLVTASRTLSPSDFPEPDPGYPEEWLELIGYRLVERIARSGHLELKEPALRLARPALRMVKTETDDTQLGVGASKIGGMPDLPPGYSWPPGNECRAIYYEDTSHVKRLAGFIAQVNLADVSHTQAARDLPRSGLLSFFCFQDMKNDNPDLIGAKAVYFPDTTGMLRAQPPKELTEGNHAMPAAQLTFVETLDLPERSSGPWAGELEPKPGVDYADVLDFFREINFNNVLGYGRSTSGGDPTPSKDDRHLIVLENSAGCRLHIQIHKDDLAARDFDKIKLVWVDFD